MSFGRFSIVSTLFPASVLRTVTHTEIVTGKGQIVPEIEGRFVGKSVWDVDGLAKTAGTLKYCDDYEADEFGEDTMLHGAFVFAPVPHARINAVDYSAAESAPGVVRIVTAADVPGLNKIGTWTPDQPVFCSDEVRFLGDFVAMVVADTPELTLPIEPGLARDDVGCKPCSQWNAVQLRDITPDAIAWSAPRAVVGDPKVDVEAAGDLLYAWNSGTEEVAYGGATFKPRMVLNGGKDVAVAPGSLRDLVVNDMRSWADGMIPNVVASNGWAHAEALQALLGPCCYGAVNRSAGVTLRRLVPGRRYRVQVFFADTRPKMGRQDFCLDGVVRLPLCDSTEGAGWSAAGDFIATAPERDILVTTFGTRESVHFQALQVRALDPLGADLRLGWPDVFIGHGTVAELERRHGFDAASLSARIISSHLTT